MYTTPWTHPTTHAIRYYVNDLPSAPPHAKVYLDSHNSIHVYNCSDAEKKAIITELSSILSHSSVIPTRSNNSLTKYTVIPSTGNIISYNNINAMTKRILSLRNKGEHVYRIKRESNDVYTTYKIFLSTSTIYDGFYTAGYQRAYRFTDDKYRMEGGRFEY